MQKKEQEKTMTTPQNHDTDVMIIGTGPTGGITALALATYGVRVHMVSMFNWLANSPRAHITNQRAMEVFRALGIEEDRKSTRLNSSHVRISYAVFCLKKKK